MRMTRIGVLLVAVLCPYCPSRSPRTRGHKTRYPRICGGIGREEFPPHAGYREAQQRSAERRYFWSIEDDTAS